MSYLFISVVIAVLALDTTIAFQLLLSQPIFTCTFLGLILGDVMVGAEIGAMMQLLWLNTVPAGGIRAPDGNIASMVTCAVVLIFTGELTPNVLWLTAFLAGLVASFLGNWLTTLRRRVNQWLYQQSLKAVEEVEVSRINLLQWGPPLFHVVTVAISVTAMFLVVGFGIDMFADQAGNFEQQLFWIKPMIWAMGLGLLADLLWKNLRSRG